MLFTAPVATTHSAHNLVLSAPVRAPGQMVTHRPSDDLPSRTCHAVTLGATAAIAALLIDKNVHNGSKLSSSARMFLIDIPNIYQRRLSTQVIPVVSADSAETTVCHFIESAMQVVSTFSDA